MAKLAASSGFADQAHMIRRMWQHTGFTPVQLRQSVPSESARAFHLAGAHEVVMSHWDLPDLGVPELMIDFARSYAKVWPDASAAAILRQAVLAYRKSNPNAPASVWAAYSVFGVGPF